MKLPRRVCVTLSAAVVLLMAASSGSARGTTTAIARKSDRVDQVASDDAGAFDPTTDPAVVSLVKDYAVTVEQAVAQMETQVALQDAVAQIPPDLQRTFSEYQIDHANGGRVTVAVTDVQLVDAIAKHFAGFAIAEIDTVIVALNAAELEDAAEALHERLANSPRGLAGSNVDVSRGALGIVTVEYIPGQLNDAEQAVIDEALANPDVYQVSEVDDIERPVKGACDRTGDIECDPPLRGSVLMTGGAICTAGFNVRSTSDNKPYVLTAGHCDSGSGIVWNTQFEDESVHAIGPFHNCRNDNVTDSGIIDVNNPTDWEFGQPWITVNPNDGGYTANDRYVIERTGNPGLGVRICLTGGNYPAATCGEVVDTSDCVTATCGLFKSSPGDFCFRGGDSGAPVFSYGTAQGIAIAHSPSDQVSCSQTIWGEEISEAAASMSVYVLTY